uniref:Bestrophin homolog n=1 Tax=Panagrolaimus sp. ES5 TaxID=591445 RepID=A0AC34FAJ3_9BILA
MEHLAWVDTPALLIATHIDGNDSKSVMLRRNIIRYMVLLQAMVFRNISVVVNKRFPTMEHLVEAGLMTQNELEVYDSIVMPQLKYWVIMSWILGLLREAKNKNLIKDSIIYTQILEKMMDFRGTVLKLSIYDWIPIPLVDMFLPIMTIIEFMLYMGLAKVAEVMLNPFGNDDEDFECNWLIDRNLQVGRAIVDSYCKFPILEKDVFWDEPIPEPLYTAETAARPHNPMVGSCNQLDDFEASLLQPHKDKIMPSKNKTNENVIGKLFIIIVLN